MGKRKGILAFLIFVCSLARLFARDFYWENPEVLSANNTRFPAATTFGDTTVLMWYEFSKSATDDSLIEGYISFAYSRNGSEWKKDVRAIGPVMFTGEPAPFASMVFNGNLVIAYMSENRTIRIERLDSSSINDRLAGLSAGVRGSGAGKFPSLSTISTENASVIPRLSINKNGEYLLFITQETSISEGAQKTGLGISFSISQDGREWTAFRPLASGPGLPLNYLPSHTVLDGRDYVVFQVFRPGRNASNHLYLVSSEDGGRIWTDPVLISEFSDTDLFSPSGVYDNQRPYLTNNGTDLFVAWERKPAGSSMTAIYFGRLNSAGTFFPDSPQRVTRLSIASRYPEIFFLDGNEYLLWFDNRAGDDRIIIAWKEGFTWRDRELTRIRGTSVFGEPVIIGSNLYVVWENRIADNSSLYLLKPDTTVPSPRLTPVNFVHNRAARQDSFRVSWTIATDSSGIAGYSYSWTKGGSSDPPRGSYPMVLNDVREREVIIPDDGIWYFNLKAQDYAGNWSDTSSVAMIRDTTPPAPPRILTPATDESGYLLSNTQTIQWDPPADPDVAGYSYVMTYLAGTGFQGDPAGVSTAKPPSQILSVRPEMSFNNQDNGIWAVSVSAIDKVGNVSQPATAVIRMNKYVPVTYITGINAVTDIVGRVNITLRGRGFSALGNIHTIILDRDGAEPWDYVFTKDQFNVSGDRVIDNWVIEDVEEGAYRIGLVHPLRGLYLTTVNIELESSGTVKFGDFSYRPSGYWERVSEKLLVLSFNSVFSSLLVLFMVCAVILILRRIISTVKEYRDFEHETRLFLTGKRETDRQLSKRIALMKKKGIGLRLKFSLLITMLITLVVLMVSVALGQYMIRTQQRSLVNGLKERSRVLLESLSTGTRAYLPGQNILELGLLPGQGAAMSDALFVTITGAGMEDEANYNYVWATNDPGLLENLAEQRIAPGRTLLDDDIAATIPELAERINNEAVEKAEGIIEEIERLGSEVEKIYAVILRNPNNTEANETFSRLNREIRQFDEELNRQLKIIADVILSYPEFDETSPDLTVDQYVFYKPVVYRSGSDRMFFRGVIRLGVSMNGIREELNLARRTLLGIAAIIALVSAVIGIIGALILATIIIIPIRRLVEGVEVIRDTEDKEELKEHLVNTKTRDELSSLADTINQMTQGLVKAAQANKELTVGKEVQKMFIPLEKDDAGNKLSTGHEKNEHIELFGYYEGAKGVSGDYFDYIQLDDTHYSFILCDVAGKGVPASLIMVEVATIFLNYFKTVKTHGKKIDLPELVYSMNDLIEERGFKGRFAALIVALLNIRTGKITLCNAGYKFVQLYKNSTGKMWSKTLNEAPATGVFPNFMVEMKGGFFEVAENLSRNDCVFLFSDGIEEAQRKFRDKNFNQIVCKEPGLKEGDLHDTHPVGNSNEELSTLRLHDVINAVFNKGVYRLVKYHNPVPDQTLTFDFTACEGTMEEAVLAMVSLEKIFRLNPDPKATEEDRITVDRKIDAYLKMHFVEYSRYFHTPYVEKENDPYIRYCYLMEDEQYDDLTILGIRKL